ncbi:hypothetical protein NSERUTF1_2007 [Nocardia seriolae]|nr:hypothetical protein NSERUTF1_2007 [Nocardia seriolae]
MVRENRTFAVRRWCWHAAQSRRASRQRNGIRAAPRRYRPP